MGQMPLLPPRAEILGPRPADEHTLRQCFSDQDAVQASIALSGLTYREIARRMKKSKSLINAIAKGERGLTHKNTPAFCRATGTTLVIQYREMQRALNRAMGNVRERDRIAAIVQPTAKAWANELRAVAA